MNRKTLIWQRINRYGWSKERAVSTPARARIKRDEIDLTKHKSLYRVYYNLLQRCNNKKHPRYKDWGGRSIKNEWKSFSEFFSDMGESYYTHRIKNGTKNTTLERIDNDGNYSKGNCRWSTWSEQFQNRRVNKIQYNGKSLSLKEWSEETGISLCVLKGRKKIGWPTDKILETPVRKKLNK